nr:hypothetical protein [Pseudodesulfovibrio nedwellii]
MWKKGSVVSHVITQLKANKKSKPANPVMLTSAKKPKTHLAGSTKLGMTTHQNKPV